MFQTAIWMPTDVPVTNIVEVAIAAEEEGFDYLLIPDEGVTRDVFVALTAVALNTKRINFGPAIINPYTRHPVVSASAIATLDELSGGRAFTGYGIGGSLVVGPLGYNIERPLRICREAIEITRQLFAGKTLYYKGDFFTVDNLGLRFKVRDIPIYFAARGSQMMTLGGEIADGQFLSAKPKFDLQRAKDTIMKGANKTGRKQKLFYSVHVAYEQKIIDDIRANYTYMVVDSPEHIQRGLGLSEEQVEEIRTVMVRDGIRGAAKFITPELLSHFIIMGSDEECAREIAHIMKEYQFDVFTLPVPAIEDLKPMIKRISSIIKRARQIFEE
jgi:5,10-methylenetetrahydromethanopterin reductase